MQDKCHICGSTTLETAKAFSQFKRVTSDHKPWPTGGEFAICKDCNHPQSLTNEQWKEDANKIYAEYRVTDQSEGADQVVFDPATGTPSGRSESLLRYLSENNLIHDNGTMLDYGCGNGAFIKSFYKAFHKWLLNGSDIGNIFTKELKEIPNFSKYYEINSDNINTQFQCISLMHALEHIPDPKPVLKSFQKILADDGILLIQVPDCECNPYVLLVADHCSHFSTTSAASLVEECGFEILHATNEWIPKEVTVIARKAKKDNQPRKYPLDDSHAKKLMKHIDWLETIVELASNAAEKRTYGIFGSSVAGIWLNHQMDHLAEFFVDEDQSRIGHKLMGKPIISPASVPENSAVFLALPPKVAMNISSRLNRPDVNWIIPPALP